MSREEQGGVSTNDRLQDFLPAVDRRLSLPWSDQERVDVLVSAWHAKGVTPPSVAQRAL